MNIKSESIWSSKRFHVFLLVFLAVTVFFGRLHYGGLASFDDCYYAEKAKEILVTGDWVTMHYNYKPSFDNPPLYIWLTAAAFKLFGISEYTAKLASALSGVAVIMLVYFFGKYLYGHWVGFYSSFILLTTHYFVAKTQRGMFDVLLTLLITLAVFCFFMGVKGGRKYFLLFGFFSGLGIMTKSIMGSFPVFIALMYLIVSPDRKKIDLKFFLLGLLVFAATACPWFIIQYAKHGRAFINNHFVWLIFKRTVYGSTAVKGQPYHWLGYFEYIIYIAKQSLPWFIAAVIGCGRMGREAFRKKDSKAILLLLWAGIILVGMSIPKAKKPWYIISIYPALSIISACVIDKWLKDAWRIKAVKAISVFTMIVCLYVLVVPVSFVKQRNVDMKKLAPHIRKHTGAREELLIYKLNYWWIQNSMLFYADRPASREIRNERELAGRLAADRNQRCLARISDYNELRGKYSIIRKEGALVLFSTIK